MTEPILTQERDILTETDRPRPRAARVSNCRYELALDLTKGAPTYGGAVTITFDQNGTSDLMLNFRGKRIDLLELNGEAVDFAWRGRELTLPGAALAGSNTLRIEYENDYDHGGDGIHQFVDPEDGEEYLYTNFEPFDAHRLFPCFDQPDIKARYRLTVTAPAEWTLTANSQEVAAETLGGRSHPAAVRGNAAVQHLPVRADRGAVPRGHGRPQRRPAGPCSAASRWRSTSIRTSCSRSRGRASTSSGSSSTTRTPSGSTDQIFVPEFNHGAMENVGAVTFNESMVYRDPPTENQRRRRAEVILHEMAHIVVREPS